MVPRREDRLELSKGSDSDLALDSWGVPPWQWEECSPERCRSPRRSARLLVSPIQIGRGIISTPTAIAASLSGTASSLISLD